MARRIPLAAAVVGGGMLATALLSTAVAAAGPLTDGVGDGGTADGMGGVGSTNPFAVVAIGGDGLGGDDVSSAFDDASCSFGDLFGGLF